MFVCGHAGGATHSRCSRRPKRSPSANGPASLSEPPESVPAVLAAPPLETAALPVFMLRAAETSEGYRRAIQLFCKAGMLVSLPMSIGISTLDQSVAASLIPAPTPIPSTDERIAAFLMKSEPTSGRRVMDTRLP